MNEKSFEFSALEGSTSLSRARIGDLSIIIERLRSDATLLIEERILIAEILGGDWTRPANRPPALDAELRNEEIKEDALLNRALDPKGRPGATRVAHAHRCSPKWVYKLLADVDADPKSHAAMHKRVGQKVALYQSIMAKLAKEAVQDAHDGVAAADP
ncbi:hypothetical protein [uncultured Brevundimonas sp.]|uniref:hypothetical protein n=1 Tax=uncultured Brevundimonas sp. TaxID=213418 RepID=UPI0025D3B41F|nr:hypothetical protein [uncultured Brevundimonas sp.]